MSVTNAIKLGFSWREAAEAREHYVLACLLQVACLLSLAASNLLYLSLLPRHRANVQQYSIHLPPF
jgi:hypothetical protein